LEQKVNQLTGEMTRVMGEMTRVMGEMTCVMDKVKSLQTDIAEVTGTMNLDQL
jgi:hypothetical protein